MGGLEVEKEKKVKVSQFFRGTFCFNQGFKQMTAFEHP